MRAISLNDGMKQMTQLSTQLITPLLCPFDAGDGQSINCHDSKLHRKSVARLSSDLIPIIQSAHSEPLIPIGKFSRLTEPEECFIAESSTMCCVSYLGRAWPRVRVTSFQLPLFLMCQVSGVRRWILSPSPCLHVCLGVRRSVFPGK